MYELPVVPSQWSHANSTYFSQQRYVTIHIVQSTANQTSSLWPWQSEFILGLGHVAIVDNHTVWPKDPKINRSLTADCLSWLVFLDALQGEIIPISLQFLGVTRRCFLASPPPASEHVTPFSVSIMTSLSTVTLTLPESLLQGSLPKVNFHLKILNLITFAKPLLPYKATFTLCKDLAGTYLGVHYSVYFRWVVCLKNHRYHKKIMYFTFILSYL